MKAVADSKYFRVNDLTREDYDITRRISRNGDRDTDDIRFFMEMHDRDGLHNTTSDWRDFSIMRGVAPDPLFTEY